jgi:hypothetical protein
MVKDRIPAVEHGWVWPMVSVLVLMLATVGLAVDGARRRSAQLRGQREVEAIVRLLGTADMALSSASRWLRHPSLSEPGAAFSDGPAILDVDPAGALIAPALPVMAGTVFEPAGSFAEPQRP